MKKSFMTRVLAVSLSAAMTFSLSAANMATASAASNVVLSPSTVTLQYGSATKAKKTLKLKNNTQGWKVKSASVAEKGSKAAGKKVVTVTAKPATNKVVVKAKNIKKSHKVTVSVKVKRTKNKKTYSKTLKCKVTVKPQASNQPDEPNTPVTPTAFTTTANATSKTSVDLTFTQPVDQAALVPANFKVDAEGVEVTNVNGGDGRNVRITLSGAEADKQYTLNITGLTVDGKAVDDQTVTFKTPVETAQGYTLKLASNTEQIKADGYAEALITCEVRDPQGELVKDKDYTIRFTSDRGSFSRPDSVTAEGVASNILRSEALDVAQDVTITAQIIRVEGTDDAGLVGKQDTMTVNMTPVLSNIIVNPIEGAESNFADRLTLHFQSKVDDDTYKTNGQIDTSRIKIDVFDDIPSLNDVTYGGTPTYTTDNNTVVNLVPVAGDPNALQVLVSGVLKDNRYIGVRVRMTDPNSGKTSTYEESFMLTDAQTPRVLKVEPLNRRQLKVTFSEAVLPKSLSTSKSLGSDAEDLRNYIIAGRPLSDPYWEGTDNAKPTITLGDGLDGVGHEGREVAIIELGEDKYFAPDKYTLTARNIGDWAAATDGSNNIITTDSKDFTVSSDDTKPDIESIDVQSPEQILVTFNKPVKKDKDFNPSNRGTVALAVKNADDETAKEKGDNSNNNSSIIELRDESNNNVSDYDRINPIRVTQVDTVGRQFLVETTKDWSKAYDQQGNYNDDYFNHKYKLYIPAGALVNKDNGEKNTSDITRDLSNEAALKDVDTVTPTVDSNISWDNTNNEATIRFSEPVKIRNVGNEKGLNDEGSTISVKQEKTIGKLIQESTVEFVSPGKQTVAGTFDRFVDTTDMAVVAKPSEDLSAGTWTVRVSGMSDDYGNTTAGGGNIEVKNETTGFEVAWASVSTARNYLPYRTQTWNAGSNDDGWSVGKDIYIYVKFTNKLNTRSSAVYDMRNYTINSTNGAEIRDAYIEAGIKGYDNNSSITDSITIVIPARSAYVVGTSPETTTLAISSQVLSEAGLPLANNGEFRLPFNSNVTTMMSDKNAVFGDNPDEISINNLDYQLGKIKNGDYKSEVEKAIKSNKYRVIKLTDYITGGLNVSRPVDIDLNGYGISGTVKASFSDGATCNIVNTKSSRDSVISDLDINTPNADWNIKPTDKGYTNNSGITCTTVTLRAIPAKTLKNEGKIGNIIVNSGSNEVKIENAGDGTINEIILRSVNKNGTVKIQNNNATSNSIKLVTVETSVKIEVPNGTGKIDEMVVKASKDVEIKTDDNAITKLTGNPAAAKIMNMDGKEQSGNIHDIVADNKDGVINALKAAMVDTASITGTTSGGSVVGSLSLKELLVDANKTIDEKGGKIEGYTIHAIIDGHEYDLNLVTDGIDKSKKFQDPEGQDLGSVADGKKVEIVIREEGKADKIAVKTITVNVKKSS